MANEKNFESATRAMFTEVITAIPSTSQDRITVDAILRRQILEHIDVLLMVRAGEAFAPETDDQRRFFDALIDGVRTGDIVLRTMNDLSAFGGLIVFALYSLPQVVEHYAHSGELLDVMRMLKKLDDQDSANASEDFEVNEKKELAHIRVLRLYDYDQNRAAELQAQEGDDESSVCDLPLEMRMEFSGFFDEISDEEHKRLRSKMREVVCK